MKRKNIILTIGVSITGLLLSGCSEDFLKPDPLSFYEPSTTFTTKEGLQSALTTCDKHMRHLFFSSDDNNADSAPINTETLLSDIAVNGTTDRTSPTDSSMDMITLLTPDCSGNSSATTRIGYYWTQGYYGIKYANSIITNLASIKGIDQQLHDEMLGRAYFHRSFRYLYLIFQYKDIPLFTQEVRGPKFDYQSTKRGVILDMITSDLEFAVKHVPAVADYGGMVTKGACRHLLIKCYLAQGEFDKAIAEANELINNSGYALMTEPFGQFVDPTPSVHKVVRNVIWDLHRPENKGISANKEVIQFMVNREESQASRVLIRTMRNCVPFWAGTNDFCILTPDSKSGAMTAAILNNEYDYRRAYGRGIARIRPTYHAEHSMWLNDATDLRHSVEHGNWMTMEQLKYNEPSLKGTNEYYGQNLRRYNDEGKLLCSDTIRSWFNWPHYKVWIEDPRKETQTTYEGGSADWYLFRLAETYLLRAEAYFWKGELGKAADDVNTIRKRAQCSKLFTAADMNMGVIMDERARELFYEEWRHVELSRVSYIFARTGKTDEFGKTYTEDKLGESNYWFERITKYNNYYNKGVKTRSGVEYTIAPYHIHWPVPQSTIDSNREGRINQNYGYAGYEHNIAPFDNLEDAKASETTYSN
ncbi:RagB/SusD family nutrient uptake outer membrane protein [Bacteroides sp. 519]|uniref:RagB/SusD family nutrient uptake outer membrane protein n=1 Tax=Bacteroides sp. 519 TaxID=2302937 RepID=UPI0013D076EE|nr:RagB/SusD family nutrient uptake outer membrane protein [Bacteroides sp. 519]NDV58649.1 RagB/SusD family nutrient uptake outer membrane protein [Bacteroides sp. 519]